MVGIPSIRSTRRTAASLRAPSADDAGSETRPPNSEVVAVSDLGDALAPTHQLRRGLSWGDGECGKLGHGNEEAAAPRYNATSRFRRAKTVSIATGQQHSLVLSDHGRSSTSSARASRASSATARRHPNRCRGRSQRSGRSAPPRSPRARCTARAPSAASYTFGYGLANQLGHGGKQNELAPRRVEALAGVRIVFAAGGEHHSLVIDDAGAVYSFGAGEAAGRTAYSSWVGGWLGHGTLDEVPLPRKIAAPRLPRKGRRCRRAATARPRRGWRPSGRRLLVWRRGRRQARPWRRAPQWTPKRIQGRRHRGPVDRRRRGALGLRDRLSFYAWGSLDRIEGGGDGGLPQPAPGSAGNYEWAPSDVLLERQAHAPKWSRASTNPVMPE